MIISIVGLFRFVEEWDEQPMEARSSYLQSPNALQIKAIDYQEPSKLLPTLLNRVTKDFQRLQVFSKRELRRQPVSVNKRRFTLDQKLSSYLEFYI